jgi:hypothetical protein
LKRFLPKLNKIRIRWPFKVATTISVVALVFSIVQFALTAPIVTSYYLVPKLVVTGKGSDPKAKVLFGHFSVTNEGRAAATKIEIGMTIQIDQRVTIMPNIRTSVVEEPNPHFFKNIRIEIERLLPKEHVEIMVFPGPSLQQLRPDIADFFKSGGMREIPLVSFIRSAEGVGQIAPLNSQQTGGILGKRQ